MYLEESYKLMHKLSGYTRSSDTKKEVFGLKYVLSATEIDYLLFKTGLAISYKSKKTAAA